MKTLYLDCGMGAAGDMLTAAQLELTPDRDAALAELNAIGIPHVTYSYETVSRCGIRGTHMSVKVNGVEESEAMHDHHHDHEHHHHHDHDADEVFTSWGVETAKKFSKADIEHALTELDGGKYGMILRSKGIVDGGADGWLEFDYVPGEWEVRQRGADVGGKLVVIGSKLDEKAIAALFGC